jgi:hypothetical protein
MRIPVVPNPRLAGRIRLTNLYYADHCHIVKCVHTIKISQYFWQLGTPLILIFHVRPVNQPTVVWRFARKGWSPTLYTVR